MTNYVVRIYRNRMELESDQGKSAQGNADFSTTRLLIGNFPIAERLLHELYGRIKSSGFAFKASRLVVRPCEMTEGGLAFLELRAFTELGLSTGIRDVTVEVA